MKVPPGTYRITIRHEQHGTVVVDHGGMDAARVEQALQLLAEAAPVLKAAQGAKAAWDGFERLLDGLGIGAPSERPRVRGRR